MSKNFSGLSVEGSVFLPNLEIPHSSKILPPGAYTLHFNSNNGKFWFKSLAINSDKILDLPSPEYSRVISEMEAFIKPSMKKKFEDLGYIYKRSALLYGDPGTGKTIIVNRVAQNIINRGGVVLWVGSNLDLLEHAFAVLSDLQPDTLTGVIMEEFDSIAYNSEGKLLTLLDGQVQKENVIYLATTNYIGDIPPRLYRPGRFSSVIEVKAPTAEARLHYLSHKLGKDFALLTEWVETTEGLSIDQLKEVVQATFILEVPLEETLLRIRAVGKIEEEYENEDVEDDYDTPKTFSSIKELQKGAGLEGMIGGRI